MYLRKKHMRAVILSILLLTSVSFCQDVEPSTIAAPVVEQANTKLKARVYYEDTGRPVRRISVMLFSIGGGREMSGTTDGNGMLEIKNMRAGKYYAVVNAPGVASPLAYLDNKRRDPVEAAQRLAAFPPIIVDGVSDLNIEIPARRGGAISGRITYSNGDPAIGVKVEVLRKMENDDFSQPFSNMSSLAAMMMGGVGSFQTDDRGVYRFAGLPAGEYVVKVTENVVHAKSDKRGPDYEAFTSLLMGGNTSMVSVFFDNVFEKEKAKRLELNLGQELYEINLVIPDRELYSLEGKVVAAKDKLPVRGAKVSIKRAADPDAAPEADEYNAYLRSMQGVTTDDEGRWSFVELPKGKYVVSVESMDAVLDVKDRAYGQSPKQDAIAMAMANAANAMANAASYASNVIGSRKIVEAPPKFAPAKKEMAVEEANVAEQTIELTFGATISGNISVETSGSAKDSPDSVTITASNDDRSTASTRIGYYERYDGQPEVPSKKDFRLTGVSAGDNYFNISISDTDYYVKSAASNQIDLLKGNIKVKESEVYANVKIVISNETGTLKGTVVDGEKRPVFGFEVTFIPTDATKLRSATYYRYARTNEKGEFEIKLPPFEYAMFKIPSGIDTRKVDEYYARLAEIVRAAQTVKIEVGKTNSVSLVSDNLIVAAKK